jgi:hypothetical protein
LIVVFNFYSHAVINILRPASVNSLTARILGKMHFSSAASDQSKKNKSIDEHRLENFRYVQIKCKPTKIRRMQIPDPWIQMSVIRFAEYLGIQNRVPETDQGVQFIFLAVDNISRLRACF